MTVTVRERILGNEPFFPLFLPANRLDRLDRAVYSGADAVVVDLEDAVGEAEKGSARTAMSRVLAEYCSPIPVLVRLNGVSTPHFEDDLMAVNELGIGGVMLPKVEISAGLEAIRAGIGPDGVVVGLVETARGLAEARALARETDRLAFGSIDFAESIGAAHQRDALLAARSELVLAAAVAGAPAPLDGITRTFKTEEPVEDDALHAASLGLGGKLLIHPAQIAAAIRGFAPDPGEVERARELLARADDNAGGHDGAMVDRPVIEAARRRIEASRRAKERLAGL